MRGKYKTKFSLKNFKKLKKYIKKINNGKSEVNTKIGTRVSPYFVLMPLQRKIKEKICYSVLMIQLILAIGQRSLIVWTGKLLI